MQVIALSALVGHGVLWIYCGRTADEGGAREDPDADSGGVHVGASQEKLAGHH